jgi:rhodanese-related sulfurtransferase
VACRSGRRSALAARQLVAGGVDAHNLSGGMAAWARAGLPVVDRRGRAGTVV